MTPEDEESKFPTWHPDDPANADARLARRLRGLKSDRKPGPEGDSTTSSDQSGPEAGGGGKKE